MTLYQCMSYRDDDKPCMPELRSHRPVSILIPQRMLCSYMGHYLIASCEKEVEDAGILITQEVLSKLLVFLIKLHKSSEKSRCECCGYCDAFAAGCQIRTWNFHLSLWTSWSKFGSQYSVKTAERRVICRLSAAESAFERL